MTVLLMAFISLLVFPADEMCLCNLDGKQGGEISDALLITLW